MKSMKAKKVKELRSKLLVAAMTAVLAVSAATYTVSAQSVSSTIRTVTSSARLKAAAGGITDIDFPSNGASVSGTINVAGWALNASGVSRVDVWAWDSNGHPHNLGSTSDFTARPDVKNALPAYNALDSGYSVSVDTTKLASGAYTLAVAGIGKNGIATWTTKTIIVGPAALTDIDAPAVNSTQDGSIYIAGWALNHSGIQRVDMYAFDSTGKPHWLGSDAGSKLSARADVKNAFPAYNALDSGYSLTVPAGTLSDGNYTLAVAGIGNDGDVKWQTINISVGQLKPLTDIDTPSNGASVSNGKLNIAGWALNESGVSRVDMYALDSTGKYHSLGSTSTSTARPDVKNAFPSYNTLDSGYNYTADVSGLSAGNYTLCVAAIGKDGSVKWETKAFNIPGATQPNLAPLTDIDTPATTYTGTIPVTGWALNASGIDRVDIYAYPAGSNTAVSLGSVSGDSFSARQDVKNAYPAYGTLNSGYSYTVPAGTLSAGDYTLAVAGVGKNGSVKWATQGISVAKVANYQGVNVTKTYTDTITGSPETVQFLGVGAGYQEVAVAEIQFQTSAALGAAHYGVGTATLTGPVSHTSNAMVGTTGTCSLFTVGNLAAGTYDAKLTAHDGTVVVDFQFTVGAHGEVE